MEGLSGIKILLADDDPHVASVVAAALEGEGYGSEHVLDSTRALERALSGEHALVILDWILPPKSGLDCCREIRAASPVPILMLTVRGRETDVVRGLEAGADDYVVKPFSVPELVVRVRALLRRRELDLAEAASKRASAAAHDDALTLDVPRRRVRVGGRPVELTRTEFQLLVLLAQQPDRLVTRGELMRELWQTRSSVESRACDFHVRNIRAKIEVDPQEPVYLVTVRGEGYRLAGPVTLLDSH